MPIKSPIRDESPIGSLDLPITLPPILGFVIFFLVSLGFLTSKIMLDYVS